MRRFTTHSHSSKLQGKGLLLINVYKANQTTKSRFGVSHHRQRKGFSPKSRGRSTPPRQQTAPRPRAYAVINPGELATTPNSFGSKTRYTWYLVHVMWMAFWWTFHQQDSRPRWRQNSSHYHPSRLPGFFLGPNPLESIDDMWMAFDGLSNNKTPVMEGEKRSHCTTPRGSFLHRQFVGGVWWIADKNNSSPTADNFSHC